jgi:hypothetical protein
MAVLDKTTGATAGASTGGWTSGIITRFNRVTFTPTAADVLQIFDVQKGEKILGIAMKVITGSNQASTIAIGLTGGTTNGYLAATSIAAAAEGTTTIGTDGVYLNGAHASADRQVAFTAADTIDALLATSGTNTCVVEFEMVSFRTTLS